MNGYICLLCGAMIDDEHNSHFSHCSLEPKFRGEVPEFFNDLFDLFNLKK